LTEKGYAARYTEDYQACPSSACGEALAKNVYWMYGIVIDEKTGIDAKELAARLRSTGVETRPFFLECMNSPYSRRWAV